MPDRAHTLLPWCAAAFLVGCCLACLLSQAPDPVLLSVSVLPTLLLVLSFPRLLPVGFIVFGAIWMLWAAERIHAAHPSEAVIGQDVSITGYVIGPVEDRGRSRRYRFKVLQSDASIGMPAGSMIRLSDYRRDALTLQPGEAWRLTVRLRPPSGFSNPGGFDYERWLFSRQIVATGYIRAAGENVRVPSLDQLQPVTRFRLRIADMISETLEKKEVAGLVMALATGDRRGIDHEQWHTLRVTGTAHLMAISGLHVGLAAWLAFWLGRLLWSLWPRLMLLLPAQKAGMLFALLLATGYSLLAGFTLPTQRALIMLAVVTLSFLLGRRVRPTNLLALAVFSILLLDPLAVLAAGFWLSFGAVAMILFSLHYHQSSSRAASAVRLQLRLSLLMAPLALLMFDQVPVLGPVANLVAIPVVAFMVVPVILLAVMLYLLGMSGMVVSLLLKLAAFILSLLWSGLEWLAKADKFVDPSIPVGWTSVLALAVVALLLVLPSGLRIRRVVPVFILLAFLPGQDRPGPGEVRLQLLDVGQGLAALVQTHNHALLFDTGARFSRTFNAGDAVVLPALQRQGIDDLDALIVSHGDNDHRGGLPAIVEQVEVRRLISNEHLGHESVACLAGMQWTWDDVSFRVLHPDGRSTDEGNNASCVLQVTSRYGSILLPADIERQAEEQLVDRYGDALQSDVLVAPHHGSRTSSSSDFLSAVSPSLVLVPAGWHNRYHHPAADVVQRIHASGARVLNTADCGSIMVGLGRSGIESVAWRDIQRRLWQRRPLPQACHQGTSE